MKMLFWSFVLLVISLVDAQNASGQGHFLKGRVVDHETSEAIPFATVHFQVRPIGVISNANGDFSLPAPTTSDTLIISCIGYLTRSFSTNVLSNDTVNVIGLTPSTTRLAEITISSGRRRRRGNDRSENNEKHYAAFKIVQMAVEKIPVNCDADPFSYVAYYRDYQLKKQQYINLNEAIVEVFDRGIKTNDQLNTRIKLFEYKRNTNFERDEEAETPYDNRAVTYDYKKNKYIPNATLSAFGGNELSILRLHDAVRNYNVNTYSFVGRPDGDFVINHYFKFEKEVLLNNIPLYCISFESKITASGPLHIAKGMIYIGKDDLAIHKLQYACYNKTMQATQLMYDIRVEYARTDGLMYLNYISFSNFFKTRNDVNFKVNDLKYNKVQHALILDFNMPPERMQALNKNNYLFMWDKEKLNITEVRLETDRRVVLMLNDRDRAYFQYGDISSRLSFELKNIQDKQLREADKAPAVFINQFRELFVQRIIGNGRADNAGYMQAGKPLSENPTQPATDDEQYWMNSPLQKIRD